MYPRGTAAIPLPPKPDLDQYRKRAKQLRNACRSGDPAAVRAWAGRWLASLASLQHGVRDSEREIDSIERDARESGLLSDSAGAACSLSDAQLFIARLHDFASWPRFAAHVEALARETSPNAIFEAAADAVV